jgi:multidrug efflux system membrane fusion protein
VLRGADGAYAWIVDPATQSVRRQAIAVVAQQDGVAVVARGLEAAQRVVVDGQYKLRPGSRVAEAAASGAHAGARVALAGGQP